MENQLKNYQRYSGDVKRLLIASGIWPDFYPIISRLIAYLGAFSTFLITLGLINFCICHIYNVIILTKCMGISISFFSSFLKICIFLIHRDDLVYLNNFLTVRCMNDLANIEDRPRFLNRFSSFAKFFYILTIAVALTFIMNIIAPIIAIKRGKYVHIYPVIFPIDFEPGGLIYWMLICLQFTGGFFVWSVTSGVDSVFGLYALQMCGQFRILSNRFENLRVSSDYNKNLKDCVERHHLLIKSRIALERIFGFLSIWLAITSAVVQCSLIFQAKMEIKTMGLFKIGYFFFYILMKLVQAFTYGWYGNVIAEESAYCLNAMYNAHWAGSGNEKFMNDVLIVLSQNPFIFKAKGCMLLHMDTFTKIIHTSASYFFLLQALDEATYK